MRFIMRQASLFQSSGSGIKDGVRLFVYNMRFIMRQLCF
jgi:hypothetical protein